MFQGNQGNDSGNKNNNQSPRWMPNFRLLLLIFGALLVWLVFFRTPGPPTLDLSYSAFLDQVRQGNVESVEIVGQRISGELETPIDTDSEGATVSGTSPLAATPDEMTNFSSTMPASGDERLLPLLDEQGVTVVAQVEQPNILMSLLFSLLPVLLLIGVIVFFMRQQMRGQQGVFNFGRSRAKNHSLDRPTVKFDDVAGADEAKHELVEVVDFLKTPDRYRQLGAKIPHGVLLVGPPGTGKTLLARSVAGEAGVPFFSTSASEFVEMFVGVGASRVRDLFEQARRNAPAIIFVDELDAIGRQRGAGMGGGHDEREQTLNQILVEMDGFEAHTDVIIIAATNRPDVLDPALLRPGRFDRQVTVDLPDVRGREAILKIHLRGKPVGSDVDASVAARQTPGFSGADLANLVNEAALHAARGGGKLIHMQHFGEALDKIVLGTRRPLLMSDHDRKVIAYHEAGHALIAQLLPETDPVNKITIMPRGRALGVTSYLPEGDRFNYSRQYLMSQLAVMLGGRGAETVAIGEITTGAENDLQRATQMSRRMLGNWGMSEELGLLFADDHNNNPFLGRELAGPRNHSEATAARIDDAVRTLLDERMQTVVRLLTEHRDKLDRLSQALIQHETLDSAGMQAAMRGNEVPPPDAETDKAPGQENAGAESAGDKPVGQPHPGPLPV